MNLTPYFKSIIDQDTASVVICNLAHEIIYMNPQAIANYHKWGGEALIGKSLMNCHNPKSKEVKDVYMIALRDENGTLIGYYEKHEYRTRDEEPFYNF